MILMPTTLNTLPSLPLPDLPIRVAPQYKVSEAQYGDGYSVVAEDGVNAEVLVVNLNWTNINQAERDIVVNFLLAHAPATPFYYTAPNRAQRPYICKEWSDTETDAGYYSVTAKLEENHGVNA